MATLCTAFLLCWFTDKVKNVVIKVLAPDLVKVSWDKLKHPEVIRYHVYYNAKDDNTKLPEAEVEVAGTVSSVLINRTFDAGLYEFEVVAQYLENGEEWMGERSDRSLMLIVDDTPIMEQC